MVYATNKRKQKLTHIIEHVWDIAETRTRESFRQGSDYVGKDTTAEAEMKHTVRFYLLQEFSVGLTDYKLRLLGFDKIFNKIYAQKGVMI